MAYQLVTLRNLVIREIVLELSPAPTDKRNANSIGFVDRAIQDLLAILQGEGSWSRFLCYYNKALASDQERRTKKQNYLFSMLKIESQMKTLKRDREKEKVTPA